jgi:hypothetical protein
MRFKSSIGAASFNWSFQLAIGRRIKCRLSHS